ncbi:MAG: phosphate acyltransferase PlsX [Lachnospiraceae bacterium]|nr:phosphate acyltransferase PlsX [Lachnospiraceae bacterium]
MSEFVRVALDAMGGDNAPHETVQGALDALNGSPALRIILVGQEDALRRQLKKCGYTEDVPVKESEDGSDWDENARLIIVKASELIEMAEPPVAAIMSKRDSSIVRAMQLVRQGKADAYVSAGSTGATLVGGQTIIGRVKGVERAPLAPFIPTEKGTSILIDCGANVDARSSALVQFAKMGSIYYKNAMHKEKPTVAIVNIGAEEEKGNALVKETFPLLRDCPGINFIGSAEARDIPAGVADVLVCEAFTGNVILKMYEGVGRAALHMLKKGLTKNLITKIGALLVKNSVKENLKVFDMSEYGGAPMLGLKGLVVKTHGSATAKEIKNSILQCATFQELAIGKQIEESLAGGSN